MDVPLYTVTGWDQHRVSLRRSHAGVRRLPGRALGRQHQELAPKETYAFRFDSRVSGDLGAQTRSTGKGTADSDMDTARPSSAPSMAPGLPFMYRRRTVVSPDDIASMLPVQLGRA
jgi:beta-galactosidase